MTDKDFLEKYDGAPFDTDELAEVALKVEGELGEAALNYLKAERKFKAALEKIGFEWG